MDMLVKTALVEWRIGRDDKAKKLDEATKKGKSKRC